MNVCHIYKNDTGVYSAIRTCFIQVQNDLLLTRDISSKDKLILPLLLDEYYII